MITPDEIRRKAERKYPSFLQAWLRGESFFPLDFPAGSRPAAFRDLQRAVEALRAHSLEKHATGYTITYKEVRSQNYGTQRIPARIEFENSEQFLRYLGKAKEFSQFQSDCALIREALPELEDWLYGNVLRVIEYHGYWPDLLKVCNHLKDNPSANVYPRELPVTVHTKFIETHTGILASLLDSLRLSSESGTIQQNFFGRYGFRQKEPLARLRFLDPQVQQQNHIPFDDLALPISALASYPLVVTNCLITENEIDFLTLPPLRDSFAIWGGGFRIEILQALEWLQNCRLYYWGDIDAQGFEILSQLRLAFSDVTSVMMDKATLTAFHDYVHPGTSTSFKSLPGLLREEQLVYHMVVENNLRLEQEHISQSYLTSILQTGIRYNPTLTGREN